MATADVGVTVAEVAAEGGRKVLRVTETQPLLSPSLERASSNINLPSKCGARYFEILYFIIERKEVRLNLKLAFKELQTAAVARRAVVAAAAAVRRYWMPAHIKSAAAGAGAGAGTDPAAAALADLHCAPGSGW